MWGRPADSGKGDATAEAAEVNGGGIGLVGRERWERVKDSAPLGRLDRPT